jgi:hypothetical protein
MIRSEISSRSDNLSAMASYGPGFGRLVWILGLNACLWGVVLTCYWMLTRV